MYKKILLALDGSDASLAARDQALDMACLAHAVLHVVCVVHPWHVSSYAGYYDPEELRRVLMEDARKTLEAVRHAMVEHEVTGTVEIVETESAADEIVGCLERCAQRQESDLVVMGTHGRHGFGRMVLGSVAEQFVRSSTCPVLLVKDPDKMPCPQRPRHRRFERPSRT